LKQSYFGETYTKNTIAKKTGKKGGGKKEGIIRVEVSVYAANDGMISTSFNCYSSKQIFRVFISADVMSPPMFVILKNKRKYGSAEKYVEYKIIRNNLSPFEFFFFFYFFMCI
jgi:hypothetical protein